MAPETFERLHAEDDDDEEEEDDDDEEEEDEEDEEEEEEENQALGSSKLAEGSVARHVDDEEFDHAEPSPAHANIGSAKVNSGFARGTAAQGPKTGSSGTLLANATHDEEVEVDDDDHVETPPKGRAPLAATMGGSMSESKRLANSTHDEELAVDDGDDVDSDHDDESIATPQYQTNTHSQKAQAAAAAAHAHGAPPSASLSMGASGKGKSGGGGSSMMSNSHWDEMVAVEGEEVNSDEEGGQQRQPTLVDESKTNRKDIPQRIQPMANKPTVKSQMDEDEDMSSDEDNEETPTQQPPELKYDPRQFANLKVSADIQQIFQFITAFEPAAAELDTKMRPFIPDYLPAVGETDTFIKIPRPDNKPDNLGLTVLDEPSAQQSNQAVVKLELQYTLKAPKVGKISEHVESVPYTRNKPQRIDKWIQDISSLHRKKPSTNVTYAKPMPDVEALLQVWPPDFEDLLSHGVELPPAKIDMALMPYAKLVCVMSDIPTHENMIESLHVLFTLYTEFTANQHFSNGPEL